MANEQKTIADMIAEKRREAQYIRDTYDTPRGRRAALDLDEEADRLEAAISRELAALRNAVIAARRVLAVWGDELPFRAWDEKGEALDKCDAALREGGRK